MPASGAVRIAGDDPAGADGIGDYVVEDQVGFLLRRAQQRHTAIFQELIAPPDLTPTQFTALLKAVELGRVTQNHLGRLAAMDPATIQGVVRRLLARGLLRRTHDPADRRTAVLVPTEAGLAAIGPAVASARRITEATLAPLSAGERHRFLSLLRKMG
jgi:DNA-binding MarR family transcriptional regulator